MSEKAPVPMTIRPSSMTAERDDIKKRTTTIKTHIETLRHRKAFESYYRLGDDRSFIGVGKKLNISAGTLAQWSKKFNWIERVQARDTAIGDRLKYESDEDTTKTRRDILKIIRTLVANMVEEDSEGNIAIKGITLKNIAEIREAYALTELILNPNAKVDGDAGRGQQVLVQIQK